MTLKSLWPCAFLALFAGVAPPARAEPTSDVVLHEWGTFLAMNGSDGVSLDGMYHEEHALPKFVHARGPDQLRLPWALMKGETPVIYFYTPHRQRVLVAVRFPRGTWTQWYPQAQVIAPSFEQVASPIAPKDGLIVWRAEIIPATNGTPKPAPPKAASDALWNYAREVDAAYVKTTDQTKTPGVEELERFLFYRGLGQATLPLKLDAASGGTLALDAKGKHGVRHVYILRVEGGKAAYAYRPALAPGEKATGAIPTMADAKPIEEFVRTLSDDLAKRLVQSGLYPKEARAMVNTWSTSYFRSEGVRALFVLPQEWTDEFIPMTVQPPPKSLVRVMVGRIELLTKGREALAQAAVRDLASRDPAVRQKAFQTLQAQGRYVEPIIRRVLASTKDENVRVLCRKVLMTDFVTDLRSAIHAASDGKPLPNDPLYARARLASLLREIGRIDEAKAEGAAVLKALRARGAPAINHSDSREYLRAMSRATEALGDDQATADQYGEFIRFGSQVASNQDCRGCHQGDAPREMAWFKGWWAGDAYARAIDRAGRLDPTIEAQEKDLESNPDDTALRLKLAYLYASKGRTRKASALWAAMTGVGDEAVASRP